MADAAKLPAQDAAPRILAFKAICARAFASQLLGGEDDLATLLRNTQLPEDCVGHFLDPELSCDDEVDEATMMTALVLISQASGLSFDRMMFEYGQFWMPYACEKAGYLEGCIHQVARTFDEFARHLNQVVAHIYRVMCKNRPWLPETHVTQTTPSDPLRLGMLVEDARKGGYAVAVLSMYSGMLKWTAAQVFQVDVSFSPFETTPLPGGAVYQSCRIEYTETRQPSSTDSSTRCSAVSARVDAPSLQTELLGVDPVSFQDLFPFHFVLDQELRVLQAGQALRQMLPALEQPGVPIANVLAMRVPKLAWDSHGLRIALGNPKAKVVLTQISGGLELRGGLHPVRLTRRTSSGQVLEGSEAILFLGSPCLSNVDEMRRFGVFMSDYSAHDPTADEALVAAAKQVQAAEALQEAHHNNRTLKRTLAQTLASQQAGVPALHVQSAAHQLLSLIDTLLVGEEVDVPTMLAARTALLKSSANVWKPLDVDWSNVAGEDKEVNQSLARLLGTGGGSGGSGDWQLAPGGVALESYTRAAANQQYSLDLDIAGGGHSPRSPGAANASQLNSTVSLAAYRRASISRSQLMTSVDLLETPPLCGSTVAGPLTMQSMPHVELGRCLENKAAASSHAAAEAFPATTAKRRSFDSAASASIKGSSPRMRRTSWLQRFFGAFKASKVHNKEGEAPSSHSKPGSSYASCASSADRLPPLAAATMSKARRCSFDDSGAVIPRPAQACALSQCEPIRAPAGSAGPSAGPSCRIHTAPPKLLASGSVTPPQTTQPFVKAAQARLMNRSSSHASTFVLLLPPSDQVLMMLRGVDDWQFDTLALDEATGGRPLSFLAFHLISRAGLIERLCLDAIKLARFLMHIEDGYGDNPYHCRTHAADVLRSLHVVLHRGGVLKAIAKHTTTVQSLGDDEHAVESARLQQLLKCYLAAIVHDYEHRGVNNDFLIKSCDPLALLYNDMSPLEMHHSAAALTLMQQPDFAFMPAANMQARSCLRKGIVEMVLATDMKQHFALTGSFTLKLLSAERPKVAACVDSFRRQATGHSDESLFSANNAVSKGHASGESLIEPWDHDTEMLVLKMVLKAADLGHLTSSIEVHKKWVARLEQELFLQGDRERTLCQPISPLMDRAKAGIQRSQPGFFSVVAQPMYSALAQAFPDCQALVTNLSHNLSHWKDAETALLAAQ